jgi:hypothetical protein
METGRNASTTRACECTLHKAALQAQQCVRLGRAPTRPTLHVSETLKPRARGERAPTNPLQRSTRLLARTLRFRENYFVQSIRQDLNDFQMWSAVPAENQPSCRIFGKNTAYRHI